MSNHVIAGAATNTPRPPCASHLAVVGRQPIFGPQMKVYAYELLFRRDADATTADVTDHRVCTAQVLVNVFFEIGIENVVGSDFVFINVDREFLLNEPIYHLPKSQVGLEILESVPPDPDVLAVLRDLAAAGYRLSLDDFVLKPGLEPFVELATVAKIDIRACDRRELAGRLDALRRPGLLLLAERVQTAEDLRDCHDLGFDLFQGHFLARPNLLRQQGRPDGSRLAALQTLALLDSPTVAIDELATAISRDVMLSYRLMRVVNSVGIGLAQPVDSLQQAIVYLGRSRIRGWVSMLLLSRLSDKPAELLTTAFVRARMCERLGEQLDAARSHAYCTAGLFSILDAFLDAPMADLVAGLPLSADICEALIDRRGKIGQVLDATVAYERCDWTALDRAGLNPFQVRDAFLDAIQWSSAMRKTLDVTGA